MLIDCNCVEDLGCFLFDPALLPEDRFIRFNIACFCEGDYKFIVRYRGRTEIIEKNFLQDEEFTLENTFDETAELFIKIKIPEDCFPQTETCFNMGVNFITSPGGACVFRVQNSGQGC